MGSVSGASNHTDYCWNAIFPFWVMNITFHNSLREGVIFAKKNLFMVCFPGECIPDVQALSHDHELKAAQSNQIPQDKQQTCFLSIHKLLRANSTLSLFFNTTCRCPLVKTNQLVPPFWSFCHTVHIFFLGDIWPLNPLDRSGYSN